ncbi:hypothetical protein TWF481_000079 [Arthrobotrys musiformis]|uniref:Uncharacterized protein n=1 Tax=Arthrobotrys musiformis TaxID=47236 RepID=A0AAV9WMP3_9PEZI
MMKDPLPPQAPPPSPLELDTQSFVDLSEFSPTTFSPTSEGTSADGLLTASLLPTLSDTFIFPSPSDGISVGGSESVSSRGTGGTGAGSRYGGCGGATRYPRYGWGIKQSMQPLAEAEDLYAPASVSEKAGRSIRGEYSCRRCSSGAASSPNHSAFDPTTPVSESRILNFFLATPVIPHIQPTSADLLLGSIYTASFLRLLLQFAATIFSFSIIPLLSTEVAILLSIVCLTSLTAWFASAGRAMKTGWAAWGLTVTLRFLLGGLVAYTSFQLSLFLIVTITAPEKTEEVESITITVPSILEKQHILDILAKLQTHVNGYITVIERDMIFYVNTKMQNGQVDQKVMEKLEKLYAGLIALGELDVAVLGEVLKGLWGGF